MILSYHRRASKTRRRRECTLTMTPDDWNAKPGCDNPIGLPTRASARRASEFLFQRLYSLARRAGMTDEVF